MTATGINVSHVGLKIIHNIEEAISDTFKDTIKTSYCQKALQILS